MMIQTKFIGFGFLFLLSLTLTLTFSFTLFPQNAFGVQKYKRTLNLPTEGTNPNFIPDPVQDRPSSTAIINLENREVLEDIDDDKDDDDDDEIHFEARGGRQEKEEWRVNYGRPHQIAPSRHRPLDETTISLMIRERNRWMVSSNFPKAKHALGKNQKSLREHILVHVNTPQDSTERDLDHWGKPCSQMVVSVDLEKVEKLYNALIQNKSFFRTIDDAKLGEITKKLWDLFRDLPPNDLRRQGLTGKELGRLVAFAEIWGPEYAKVAQAENKSLHFSRKEIERDMHLRGIDIKSFPRSLVVTPDGNLHFQFKTKDVHRPLGKGSHKEVKLSLDYKNLKLNSSSTVSSRPVEVNRKEIVNLVNEYFSQGTTDKRKRELAEYFKDILTNHHKSKEEVSKSLFSESRLISDIHQCLMEDEKRKNLKVLEREIELLKLVSGQEGVIRTEAAVSYTGRVHLSDQQKAMVKSGRHPKEYFDKKRPNGNKFLILQEHYKRGDLSWIENREKIKEHFQTRPNKWPLLFKKMAKGIHSLHKQGIIHRDIKPDNFLIDYDDNFESFETAITDLGLAVFKDDKSEENKEWKKTFTGTPNYLPPETLSYLQEVKENKREQLNDEMGDMWSLGLTFFELFEGSIPSWHPLKQKPGNQEHSHQVFDHYFRNPNDFAKAYPEPSQEGRRGKMKHLIWRMLKIKPEERITIPELLQELEKMQVAV